MAAASAPAYIAVVAVAPVCIAVAAVAHGIVAEGWDGGEVPGRGRARCSRCNLDRYTVCGLPIVG